MAEGVTTVTQVAERAHRIITSKLSSVSTQEAEKDAQITPVLADKSALEAQEVFEFFTREMIAVHDELVKRTRTLEMANHRLEEIDALKTRLLGDLAHDLRAPLASILLKLDLIERGKPENQERYLNDIRAQVRRLGHMMESMLDLTRIYMSNPVQHFADLDFNHLIQTVFDGHREQARLAKLDYVYVAMPALPVVRGEREQLERVFENIIGNALKYTLEGCVQVTTGVAADRQWVWCAVQDTGIGIAAEDVATLFDRFRRGRVATEAKIQGTGLGLAIAKEIVELHGGRITVESAVGTGSTFRVTLPTVEV
ncbi:MAG: HAMP domain-containing sensor histidine kinase [Chloroflexota bacterium]|nr:HAMP domain-containing sensor histidine kinase [Chloroflexota bacterium]